jgi:toxin ParE1/3/4
VPTAKRFLAKLRSHLEHLALLGHSGVPRNELSPGLCLVVHGNYNIYFRLTPTETIIVRVLHSARDVRRFSFHEDPPPAMAPILPGG